MIVLTMLLTHFINHTIKNHNFIDLVYGRNIRAVTTHIALAAQRKPTNKIRISQRIKSIFCNLYTFLFCTVTTKFPTFRKIELIWGLNCNLHLLLGFEEFHRHTPYISTGQLLPSLSLQPLSFQVSFSLSH